MGYYDDIDENTLAIVLLLSLAITLLCCVTCPGEGLIFIGTLHLISGFANATKLENPSFIFSGFISFSIWGSIGLWKIRNRRRQQEMDVQLQVASQLSQVGVSSVQGQGNNGAGGTGGTGSGSNSDAVMSVVATPVVVATTSASTTTTKQGKSYEMVNTQESSDIV